MVQEAECRYEIYFAG